MSDRHAELRRQRELVQEHLAWLDREIAAEGAKQNPTQTAPPITAVVAGPTPPNPLLAATFGSTSAFPRPDAAPAALAVEANPDADRILEEYRVSASSLHSDIRKGCFLYFAAALAVVAAVVAVLYLTLSHR